MATSGSAEKSVTSYDTLRFSWWFNSGDQNITNNTTLVRWKLELIASAYGYISSSGTKIWEVNVNGTPYSGYANVGISNNSTKTLAEGTTVVAHNPDGSKTFNFSFYQSFSGITFSGVALGLVQGSGSGVLTTIPRASSLTVATGILGTAQNLIINRAVNSFTHTITYTCGRYSGTVATKTASTSVSFTPAIEWATGAPNGDKVYIVLKIETFNGSTSIGSKTYEMWAYIPESVAPSISGVVISEGASEVPSGFPYVQGKSKLNIKVTATGNQGSSIQRCVCEVAGVSYSGTNVITNVINQSGMIVVKVTVTDSRGRTATKNVNVTIVEYSVPSVSASVTRCDSRGNVDEAGEYMKVTYTMSISSLNEKNATNYGIRYRKASETDFVTENFVVSAYLFESSSMFEADTGSTYVIEVFAKDSFIEVPQTLNLSTAYTIFNISADGKGFAFGKVSEREGIEFAQVLYDGDGNEIPVGDTGWIELPLNTGWFTYKTDYPYDVASYRKIGNIVYLRGLLGASAEAGAIVGSLPAGYRPAGGYNRFIVCDNQYDNTAIQINMQGAITDMEKVNGVSTARMFLNLAGVFYIADN